MSKSSTIDLASLVLGRSHLPGFHLLRLSFAWMIPAAGHHHCGVRELDVPYVHWTSRDSNFRRRDHNPKYREGLRSLAPTHKLHRGTNKVHKGTCTMPLGYGLPVFPLPSMATSVIALTGRSNTRGYPRGCDVSPLRTVIWVGRVLTPANPWTEVSNVTGYTIPNIRMSHVGKARGGGGPLAAADWADPTPDKINMSRIKKTVFNGY